MTLILASIALAVLTAVLFLTLSGPRRRTGGRVPGGSPEAPSLRQPCPLCGSRLASGEKVHSTVYATKTADTLMQISGCPHCRPPATLRRQCPVCKNDLKPDEVVTARVFERPDGAGSKRTHVHVLGCPGCRKTRSP